MDEVKSDSVRKGRTSASYLPREMRCAGSRRLCKGLPNKSTPYSQSGDKIHAFLAHNFNFDELSKSEQKTCDVIMFQEGEMVERNNMEEAEVIREERIWHSSGLVSAQLDVCFIKGDTVLCCNYKSGHLSVESLETNEQVLCEALLAMRKYGAKKVVASIISPHDPESGLQEITFTESDLEAFEKDMLAAIELADDPDAPLIPGNYCKYCPAKEICPAAIKEMVVVSSVFGVPVSTLTPDQRGELASKLERAEKLIKSYKEQIKECLKDDPTAVSGWRLGSTGSSMKVIDEDAIRGALASGLSGRNLARCFKFNKAEAIEATAEAFSLSEAKAKEQVDKLIRPYVRFEKKEKKMERIRKTETKEIENE